MPFHFLHLPQEIQDMIFKHYLRLDDTSTINCVLGESEARPRFYNIPSLTIELVCRKFSQEIRQLRSRLWPRTLHFQDNVDKAIDVDVVAIDDRNQWLHQHIEHIITNDSSLMNETERHKFRNVRHLTTFYCEWWHDEWLHGSYVSLQTLKGHVQGFPLYCLCSAVQHATYAHDWSGQEEDNIYVTMVGWTELEDLKIQVQIQRTLRYFTAEVDHSNSFKLIPVSTKVHAHGQIISEQRDHPSEIEPNHRTQEARVMSITVNVM